MVNVGSGNLVMVASDVDIPEPGIDLTFRRVYNSQSLHDFNGDDGAEKAVYGERWTNNLDAHTVYYPAVGSTPAIISVYDIDGTRCDYTATGSGTWKPCAGQHATLFPSDSTDCTYYWQKPSGTYYVFHAPSQTLGGSNCGILGANVGRLSEIVGRNNNNFITITPSYPSTGPKTAETLTQVVAQHSDGDKLTLTFGVLPSGQNELATITLPDGNTIYYSYDVNGNLTEVDKPGNNMNADPATQTLLAAEGVPAGTLPEIYGYAANVQVGACSPRLIVSAGTASPTDGSCEYWDIDSSQRVTERFYQGLFNPTTSNDGVGGAVQPHNTHTGIVTADAQLFSGVGTGTTTVWDWLGHETVYSVDSAFRVSGTTEYTGSTTGPATLTTATAYDANNNLISTTDARLFVTNYSYDANGNTVKVQLPMVTTSLGSLRPTSYYSWAPNYQNNPNFPNSTLLSYCDPYNTAKHSFTSCATSPGTANVTTYQYNAPSYEPYGELTDTYTPIGYHRAISYNAQNQGGTDLGLPTQVQGDAITLPGGGAGQEDGTARQPVQHFVYDATGDLTSYDEGGKNPQGVVVPWSLQYDIKNMHRVEEVTDPDKVSSFKCHYPDGSVFFTESAAQHGADPNRSNACPAFPTNSNTQPTAPAYAVAYTYDVDGDETTEVHHFGQFLNGGNESLAAAPTYKFYDGLDRLVEVAQPRDVAHDIPLYKWMTRYFYDFNAVGPPGPNAITIDGNPGNAFGNLYATWECLPSSPTVGTGACSMTEARGTSFDGLDRPVAQYEDAIGGAPKITNVYDINGNKGLLDHTFNSVTPSKQISTYTYDNAARTSSVTFNDATPSRNYVYDPNGRVTSIAAPTAWNGAAYTNQYDAEGNLTQTQEPSGLSNAGTVNYAYYPDGKRATLGLTITGYGSFPKAFAYSYRVDGLPKTQQVSLGVTGTYSWLYTAAGREYSQSDPSTGASPPLQAVELINQGTGVTTTYPVTYGARTTVYDAYGQESSVALPSGFGMSSPSYDLEGERLDYQITNIPGSVRPIGPAAISTNAIYSNRGELVSETPDPGLWQNQLIVGQNPLTQPPFSAAPIPCEAGSTTACATVATAAGGIQSMALGYNAHSGDGLAAGGSGVTGWDARSDQIRSGSAGAMLSQRPPSFNPSGPTIQFNYDLAGRQTDKIASNCMVYPPPMDPSGTAVSTGGTQHRVYDAENHETSQSYSPQAVTNTYGTSYCPNINGWSTSQSIYSIGWGLTGHPWTVSNIGTEHWDGDSILYEVGAGLTIFVGKLGWVYKPQSSSSPIATEDRDWTGQEVQFHQIDAFSDFSLPGARLLNTYNLSQSFGGGTVAIQWWPGSEGQILGKNSQEGPFPPDFLGPIASMARPDGYQLNDITVQGVRVYDPSMSQWTTPDAYAGDVHDPSSQKPFMWNGNNPIAFSDPSGYVSQVANQVVNGTNSVTIDAYLIFSGDADNATTEQEYIDNVQSTWGNKTVTGSDGQTYTSTLNIHVVTDPSQAPAGMLNHINITNDTGARGEPTGLNDHINVFSGNLTGAGPAHEFGHLLGINDHYCVSSLICGSGGVGKPYSWAHNDIMADYGAVNGNDFADLLGTHHLAPPLNLGP